MTHTEKLFAAAEISWDLERLYTDLGKAKGKFLTSKEKLYLRGLLCGYGPAEIAKKCHKSAGGLKVNLSKTLYQYVKVLVNKEHDKIENWTNIREWLEEIGYNKPSTGLSKPSNQLLSIYAPNAENISVENNRIDISFGNGVKTMDINIQLVIPPSSDSSEKD